MLAYKAFHIYFQHQSIQNVVLPIVSATHTSVQPFAMVIKAFHTLVANTTVFYFGATTGRLIMLNIIKTYFLHDFPNYITNNLKSKITQTTALDTYTLTSHR